MVLHPTFTLFPYTTLFRSRGEYPLWGVSVCSKISLICRESPVRRSARSRARRSPPTAAVARGLHASRSCRPWPAPGRSRSEEHTSELQSCVHHVFRLLLEK